MKNKKMYGFSLPNLFGHSTFSICFFYYDAWPNNENGTNYWCLEISIGWPSFGKVFDIKCDFWNPKDMAGWRIIKNSDGSQTSVHESMNGKT